MLEFHKFKGFAFAEIVNVFKENGFNKNSKQIRYRWVNYVDPNLNMRHFSKEEEQHLFTHYKEIGPKWTLIAVQLSGRPENKVKNFFYSFIRKMKLQLNKKKGISLIT